MKRLHFQLGFTMIELLIVITILGILAVAVLSAINPIEQINRGRDTGRQSDAEQLLSAIDRFNAFQGYYPWQVDANDENIGILGLTGLPIAVSDEIPYVGQMGGLDPGCPILNRLSTGIEGVDNCAGAQELKESFVRRVVSGNTRELYIYNRGLAGDSTYVCFVPQSGAFDTQAKERCADPTGAEEFGLGLPVDIIGDARNFICDPTGDYEGKSISGAMICLP